MPSLSYSELVGLVIAGAVVLLPLTQTEPPAGPARFVAARSIASTAGGSDTPARFICPRRDAS